MIRDIDPDIRVGCLSNTSELHWHHQKAAPKIHELFDLNFLSFELGLSKPEPELYQTVANKLGCPASAILFFDDNQKNVDSAIKVVYDSHRVEGPEAARQILKDKCLSAN